MTKTYQAQECMMQARIQMDSHLLLMDPLKPNITKIQAQEHMMPKTRSTKIKYLHIKLDQVKEILALTKYLAKHHKIFQGPATMIRILITLIKMALFVINLTKLP
jgi:hypothetical protein